MATVRAVAGAGSDVRAKNCPLPRLMEGALIAFYPAGACGTSMAGDYCLRHTTMNASGMNAPDMNAPELSILIVAYNSSAVLPACLASVEVETTLAHEIIIVDNASVDGTASLVRTRFPQVALIENRVNVGFAVASNQASRLARGRYLLLLNPDTVVHTGSIDRLVRFMDANPTVGICAPRVLTTDGRIRPNCFAFETPWSFFWFGVGVGPLLRVRSWLLHATRWNVAAAIPQLVEAVTGAAMLVRRDLFERLGGLDDRFFMYCEDGDLCYRACQQGRQTMLVPDAVVTHIRGASTPPDTPLLNGMVGAYLLHSRYRYTQKYWGRGAVVLLRLANAAAGVLFLLVSRLLTDQTNRIKLARVGRLLWATHAFHKGD
jgi:N-acetylglucosaminyl-diphospho-decaprenol L-rhamnosyltransferase